MGGATNLVRKDFGSYEFCGLTLSNAAGAPAALVSGGTAEDFRVSAKRALDRSEQ